ncbi:MAG: DUF3990 domain-containing protein [Treponema sp.]|nr:DUF3990 domain-containing protein [Treponema sp.]
MKPLILYHGSDHIIRKPLYNYGKIDNDFGRGFYCTCEIELGKEWACQFGKPGIVNKYTLDMEGLKVLYLNASEFSILHWLSVLVQNREIDDIENLEALEFLKNNYTLHTNKYDLIIGYRADDSYFTFARDFINDGITLQTLYQAMTLGKLGVQYVLKSKKAFDSIIFNEASDVPVNTYYTKYKERDSEARKNYQTLKRTPKSEGIIMTEIIKNPQLLLDFETERVY